VLSRYDRATYKGEAVTGPKEATTALVAERERRHTALVAERERRHTKAASQREQLEVVVRERGGGQASCRGI